MESHPFRMAGAVGAGIAVAAWIASRVAKNRRTHDGPGRAQYPTTTRPVTPARPPVTPQRPTPPRPTPPSVVIPIPAPRQAEVTQRLTLATTMGRDINAATTADDAAIATLTGQLASALHGLSRPGEDLTATTIRVWRQLETEAQRQWPGSSLARRAGDIVWEAVFLAEPTSEGDPMVLAPWTQTRSTTLVTNERIGTDELLVRVTAAHAAVRQGQENPLTPVIELWRRGVVPDVTPAAVVCRRGGVVVASAPKLPDVERGVA